jgi:CubicO group peptidase (beta-lactamase class C family)
MSIPFAAGGLYSTVEDLYTLDRALVAGDLLPADLREQMWTPHAAIPGPGPTQSYGYGWTITEGPQGKVVGHNGSIEGFSSGLRHYLEPDLLIVVLSNEEQRNPNRVLDGIAEIVLP